MCYDVAKINQKVKNLWDKPETKVEGRIDQWLIACKDGEKKIITSKKQFHQWRPLKVYVSVSKAKSSNKPVFSLRFFGQEVAELFAKDEGRVVLRINKNHMESNRKYFNNKLKKDEYLWNSKEAKEFRAFFKKLALDSNGSPEIKSIEHRIESKFIAEMLTPYLVDHSGFDALAYLIEAEGKRLFYSGDFRGHGRKSILFDCMIDNPLKEIDYLLLEGSMIGRDSAAAGTEEDIENELVAQFKGSDDLFFIACSSQNIDRLVSIFRACVKSNRIFVIDPYTALVLDRLKKVSSGLPQFDWGKNIRIFFVPNNYTQKMADDGVLFKFKSAKIDYEEMQKSRNKLVIKDTFKLRTIFAKRKELSNTKLIYSMWEGYLAGVEQFWKDNNVPIIKIHCSGHAYISELQAFVKAMNPKVVIPNHTFYPEKFASLFDKRIMVLKDGQTVDL